MTTIAVVELVLLAAAAALTLAPIHLGGHTAVVINNGELLLFGENSTGQVNPNPNSNPNSLSTTATAPEPFSFTSAARERGWSEPTRPEARVSAERDPYQDGGLCLVLYRRSH